MNLNSTKICLIFVTVHPTSLSVAAACTLPSWGGMKPMGLDGQRQNAWFALADSGFTPLSISNVSLEALGKSFSSAQTRKESCCKGDRCWRTLGCAERAVSAGWWSWRALSLLRTIHKLLFAQPSQPSCLLAPVPSETWRGQQWLFCDWGIFLHSQLWKILPFFSPLLFSSSFLPGVPQAQQPPTSFMFIPWLLWLFFWFIHHCLDSALFVFPTSSFS